MTTIKEKRRSSCATLKQDSDVVKAAAQLIRLGVFAVSLLPAISLAAPGFNYPVGARNPGVVTWASDGDGWYNVQDFMEYNAESIAQGYHSGEDWNDECGGANDVGASVHAVADGEVVGFRTVVGGSGQPIGDVVVLEHSVTGAGSVYSLYLHIARDSGLYVGQQVERDQTIGEIADISASGLSPHLHFEMRTRSVDVSPTGQLWPNDDDARPNNAYYSDTRDSSGNLILSAGDKMDRDGLIDPSDFVDSARPTRAQLARGRIPSDFYFDRDLSNGSCRYEVRYLQTLLNSDPDTRVANSGDGSLGAELSRFGPATEAAVVALQQKYLPEQTASGQVDSNVRTELNTILRSSRERANVDVVLIIDSSGSMISTDPQYARLDAARAYLTGSFWGDFVGVVDFDSYVRRASGLQRLPENRDSLIDAIETIDSSGGTNIGLGLQEGCNVLRESPSAFNFTKGAILLTLVSGVRRIWTRVFS